MKLLIIGFVSLFALHAGATTIEYKITFPDNEVKTYSMVPSQKEIRLDQNRSCTFLESPPVFKALDGSISTVSKSGIWSCSLPGNTIVSGSIGCIHAADLSTQNTAAYQDVLPSFQSREFTIMDAEIGKKGKFQSKSWKFEIKCIY